MNEFSTEGKTQSRNPGPGKKIAYIVTRDEAMEILEDNLSSLVRNEQTVEIVAIYFVDNGVYQIVKGARIANKIRDALRVRDIFLYVDDESVKKRNLQNMLLEDAKIGTIADFYASTQDADHIIAL